MKRYILYSILCCFLLPFISYAQHISQTEALSFAKNYYLSHLKDSVIRKQYAKSIDATKIDKYGKCYLVEFNDGWALVSPEKAVKPILAFSKTGSFPKNSEDIPCGMKDILAFYDKIIDYAKDSVTAIHPNWLSDNNKKVTTDTSDVILERMQQVKWNQSWNNDYSCEKAYNAQCPTFATPSCEHNYVGCSAVALGQVLWFYQYPFTAIVPTIMTDTMGHATNPKIKRYDYNLMPPELHNTISDEKFQMLTGFLRDCGYSIGMKYKKKGSAGPMDSIRYALNNRFGYYASLSHHYNTPHGVVATLIKNEILNGRPVIMSGANSNGQNAHAFVVYGYDADNRLYINWGWGGSNNNASFALDNLTPPTNHNYSFYHNLITGIRPIPRCTSTLDCTPEIINYDFIEMAHNPITLCNKVIDNNSTTVVYSGVSVTISSNFEVKLGSELIIDIKDIPCNQ